MVAESLFWSLDEAAQAVKTDLVSPVFMVFFSEDSFSMWSGASTFMASMLGVLSHEPNGDMKPRSLMSRSPLFRFNRDEITQRQGLKLRQFADPTMENEKLAGFYKIVKMIPEGFSFKYACKDFCFFQFFDNFRETMKETNALYDVAIKLAVEIRKLTRLRDPREFVITCAIYEVESPILPLSSIEITEDPSHAAVS
ncbi:hypothetical protein F2Q68_00014364 [Brassica cretica]|uniref:Uncharacterized protein n=1 Tax=Brassica cretica TaxID=69181 RepID=A0A8S9HPF1_BRACR|nr:hypothetical protein F2Q68_00014364 [Brassica cretica]